MTDDIAFVDCETTGLDPRRHAIWEIALEVDGVGREWQLGLTQKELARADPGALRVGHYYERRQQQPLLMPLFTEVISTERRWKDGGYVSSYSRDEFVDFLMEQIGSRHLAGMAVTFDAQFIGALARRHGRVPAWHYHLIDVEALAAGRLRQPPPWRSDDLVKALGIDASAFPRHTALGDARLAKAVYEAVMNDPAQQTT